MVTRPRIGSLCSGFGGLDHSTLDALQGGSVVWHAETDPDASRVLKTPRATDGVNGGPGDRGRRGDLAMPSAVQPEHWGEYAEAVATWEAISGVPAPAPTEPNANGAPRLASGFVEWVMDVPAGMIAGQVDRNAALRLLGNGVVRRQGAGALSLLLDAPMTHH